MKTVLNVMRKMGLNGNRIEGYDGIFKRAQKLK